MESAQQDLVVRIGVNAHDAKVFKAHAAPLGLCDNVIHALKLLANQLKDGDSPIQSLATGLHERSRKGIIGRCKKIHPNRQSTIVRWTSVTCVKAPDRSRSHPEAAVREGADEFTLRADEVGTLKAFINVDYIEYDRWEPPLVDDAYWHATCQAIYQRTEGEEWEELYCHCGEMSKATGAKNPSESRKSKKPFGQ